MDDRPSSPVIGRRGVASVGIASVVAAASGYAVLVLVAHHITLEENAEFLVFWSLLFCGYGILGGIQQESTRSVGAALLPDAPVRRGARVLPWSLALGATLAAVAAVASPWWFERLLPGQPWGVVVLLCVSGILYAGYLASVGGLAGGRHWTTSSFLVGGESSLRLVLTVVAVVVGSSVVGLEVAVAVPAVFWLVVVLLSGRVRHRVGARADGSARQLLVRSLQAMVGSAGAAALIVGYPTLLRATTDDAQWATAAPLVLAISMTRAPLLIPLNAFQGVAISYLLDPNRRRAEALTRITGVVVLVGSAGAAAAYLVGPWLMATLFGPEYRVDGGLLAGLTIASTLLAVLTVTGSGVLALGRHTAYAAGWFVATAVSVAILLTDLPLSTRAVLSLAVGPVAGVVVHLAVLGSTPAVRANLGATSDLA